METLSHFSPNNSIDFLLANLPFIICALASLTEYTREMALTILIFLDTADESTLRLVIHALRFLLRLYTPMFTKTMRVMLELQRRGYDEQADELQDAWVSAREAWSSIDDALTKAGRDLGLQISNIQEETLDVL